MKKKNIFITITILCIIAIIIALCFVGDKKLNIEDKLINELYSYLGEVDVYHCGGLNAYNSSSVTKDSINNSNLLCMAYYNLEKEQKEANTSKSTGKNKNDNKICKIGEKITFITGEETDECAYETIKKEDLNNAYKSLYGTDIKDHEEFYITNDDACYLEGETYYCGAAETFTVSLAPTATIYRLIDKAIEKRSGEINIYDYFLKVSEDKCYMTNSNDNENEDCSKALKKLEGGFSTLSQEEKAKFMKKYGMLYRHTYMKNKDSYYWTKSEQK